MSEEDSQKWRFNRQVNVSVLVQLMFLASLIVGSWVNLQRQLDLLQHDVTLLIQSNQKFQQKLETLWAEGIAREYRLRSVEKGLAKGNTTQ